MLAGLALTLPEEKMGLVRTTDKQARELAGSGVAGLLDPGLIPMYEDPSWGNAGMLALGMTGPTGKGVKHGADKVIDLAEYATKRLRKSKEAARKAMAGDYLGKFDNKFKEYDFMRAEMDSALSELQARGIPYEILEAARFGDEEALLAIPLMLEDAARTNAWDMRKTPAKLLTEMQEYFPVFEEAVRGTAKADEEFHQLVQEAFDSADPEVWQEALLQMEKRSETSPMYTWLLNKIKRGDYDNVPDVLDEQAFYKNMQNDVNKIASEMMEKVNKYDGWKWDIGTRVRSKKTGGTYEIVGKTWDNKNDRPMYKYKALTSKHPDHVGSEGQFIAEPSHDLFDILDGPRTPE